jgi:hypothetical protein
MWSPCELERSQMTGHCQQVADILSCERDAAACIQNSPQTPVYISVTTLLSKSAPMRDHLRRAKNLSIATRLANTFNTQDSRPTDPAPATADFAKSRQASPPGKEVGREVGGASPISSAGTLSLKKHPYSARRHLCLLVEWNGGYR